jgi:hypothetical protein
MYPPRSRLSISRIERQSLHHIENYISSSPPLHKSSARSQSLIPLPFSCLVKALTLALPFLTMSASSPSLIVFYYILSAGLAVMMGYAVSRLYGTDFPIPEHSALRDAQAEPQADYMRRVRLKNRAAIGEEARDVAIVARG